MTSLRHYTLLAVVLLGACNSGTTVVDVDVASVVVTPPSPTVEVGLTVQFEASALDESGTELTGQPVTWESTAEGVATIGSDGVALGVSVGTTQIRATIGDVTSAQTLTVEPSSCTTRTDVVLAPGEYAVFPGDECLLLPAGADGDLYRVALTRPTLVASPGNVPTVTLAIAPVLTTAPVAASEAPLPGRALLAPRRDQQPPRIDGSRILQNLEWQDATRAFHIELRMRERELGLGTQGLLPSMAGTSGAPPARTNHPVREEMYLDLDCTTSDLEPVRLIDYNDNLAIYQDSVSWAADPISAAAAGEMLSYYDSYVKDMIVEYWGPQPDVDADGRVLVVTTPDLGENVAAAVFSCDFYQNSAQTPGSNEGEVIYFRADLIRQLSAADPSYFALGVLAHEAKHVTSLYNGIERGGSGPAEFNDLWIEEGTAELSQVMSSRIAWAATGGPAVNAEVTGQAILDGLDPGNVVTKEMSAVVDEVAGVARSLSAQPNSVITDPNGAPEEHSFYLNSWLWHRFLGDAFGDAPSAPRADSAFFRALTDPSTPAGAAAGEILLTGRSFEQLFEDFVVAVSFHKTGFSPTYEFGTWDFVSAADVFSNPNPDGSFPWPVTATEPTPGSPTQWAPFASDSFTGTIGPSGVRFHDFRSSGSAAAQISVTGLDQSCYLDTSMRCDRIVVSRID